MRGEEAGHNVWGGAYKYLMNFFATAEEAFRMAAVNSAHNFDVIINFLKPKQKR
jgi:hypothetical protein